jgi:hypothetical protein
MTAKYPLLTFTVMKNEGPFLLEWIAYQKVFGADKILVMTNDCEDGTDRMLDRLDDMGVVRHVPNPCGLGPNMIGKARHPHILGFEYGKLHKEWRDSEYILMCDTDEFPVVHVGDGGLDALMDAAGAPDILSLSERMFGADEHVHFTEQLILERFTRCSSSQPGKWRARKGIKSISRNHPQIDIRNHRPLLREEDADRFTWVDGSGAAFPEDAKTEHVKGLDCRGRYDLGAIHHYALRTFESFLVKVDRGDAVALYEDRLDTVYFRRRNRVDDINLNAHPKLEAVRDEMTTLMRDDDLKRQHYAAVRYHRNKIYRLLEHPVYKAMFDKLLEETEATRRVKRRKGEEVPGDA